MGKSIGILGKGKSNEEYRLDKPLDLDISVIYLDLSGKDFQMQIRPALRGEAINIWPFQGQSPKSQLDHSPLGLWERDFSAGVYSFSECLHSRNWIVFVINQY